MLEDGAIKTVRVYSMFEDIPNITEELTYEEDISGKKLPFGA